MNDERRKQISIAIRLAQRAHAILEECANDEQDYFDNMPEGIQMSEKGEAAEQAAGDLEQAAAEIECQLDMLTDHEIGNVTDADVRDASVA